MQQGNIIGAHPPLLTQRLAAPRRVEQLAIDSPGHQAEVVEAAPFQLQALA